MYPNKLEIVVELDTMQYWRVYLNGICSSKWRFKENAKQFVREVKEMNQHKEITVTFIA